MEEISYDEESDGHEKDTWLSAKDTTLMFTCMNITDIDVIMFIAGGTWMSSYLGVYKTYENSNIFVLRTIRNNKVLLRGRPEMAMFPAYEIPSHKRGEGVCKNVEIS